MSQTIYYLPGHGGLVSTGLGAGIMERGFSVTGRETVGDFRQLRFMDQVALVEADLKAGFWSPDDFVVANSFGAYLFLNAQVQMAPYPGRVLLLSPIVGAFEDEVNQRMFSPPYPDRVMSLIVGRRFPKLPNAQIHVGELDWQSVPGQVQNVGDAMGALVTVVAGTGHMLGKQYVGALLDRWLPHALPSP